MSNGNSRPVCPRCGNAITARAVKKGMKRGVMTDLANGKLAIQATCPCGYKSKHAFEYVDQDQ